MTELQQINVDLGTHSYPIFLGHDYLEHAADVIAPYARSKNIFIISDELVSEIYMPMMLGGFEAAGFEVTTLNVPQGEESKSFEQAERLLERILKIGCDRQTLIIALGGGVVGDLAGFCASVLLRGLDFIQIPTTLLAQTDSSVGGKTGINSSVGKNLIGTFHQPKAVLIDTLTLKTLDPQQMIAGYAEVVKYGIILKPDFFAWLEENGERVIAGDEEACMYAIEQSCLAKAEVVQSDEFERTGKRALLNFGHTFAHAFEAASGMDGSILHGEAVALGSILAARLSSIAKLCSDSVPERIRAHFEKVGLPIFFDKFRTHQIITLMKRDKKVENDQISLVLLKDFGHAVVVKNVGTDLIERVLG